MKLLIRVFGVFVLGATTGLSFVIDNTSGAKTAIGPVAEVVRYEIDASKSKFFVHAYRGGPAYFKGHDHLIAVRDFSGQAALTLDSLNPASLSLNIRASSLAETSDVFTPQQKDIINKELEEIVLETAKYPEITFKSSEVKGGLKNGQFELTIGGDITLHGVTKHIVIPATVTVEGDALRAKGEFELDRTKFNVEATSAFHGLIRIKNKLKFTFDIIGHRT